MVPPETMLWPGQKNRLALRPKSLNRKKRIIVFLLLSIQTERSPMEKSENFREVTFSCSLFIMNLVREVLKSGKPGQAPGNLTATMSQPEAVRSKGKRDRERLHSRPYRADTKQTEVQLNEHISWKQTHTLVQYEEEPGFFVFRCSHNS